MRKANETYVQCELEKIRKFQLGLSRLAQMPTLILDLVTSASGKGYLAYSECIRQIGEILETAKLDDLITALQLIKAQKKTKKRAESND